MPEKKAAKETGIESADAPMTAAEFKKVIEAYKEQNPAKYELKKEALEEKLKSLK